MPFDLRINVSGVCAWMVDDNTNQVHVLMPVSNRPGTVMSGEHSMHAGHTHPQHFARLVYDQAYEQPNDRQLSPDRRCIPLERTAMEFPAGLGSRIDTTLPQELIDITQLAQIVLPRAYVQGAPTTPVTARVSFGCGRFTDRSLGHALKLGGQPVTIANSVEWTIGGIDADRLDLESLLGRKGSPSLFPKGDAIRIAILHGPKNELEQTASGNPVLTEPIEHFFMYYLLDPNFNPKRHYPQPGGPFGSTIKSNCTFSHGIASDGLNDNTFEDENTNTLHVKTKEVEYVLPMLPRIVTYSKYSVLMGAQCSGARFSLG